MWRTDKVIKQLRTDFGWIFAATFPISSGVNYWCFCLGDTILLFEKITLIIWKCMVDNRIET